MKEEFRRFGALMDGLRKDQLALAHRLGSLEDRIESGRDGGFKEGTHGSAVAASAAGGRAGKDSGKVTAVSQLLRRGRRRGRIGSNSKSKI